MTRGNRANGPTWLSLSLGFTLFVATFVGICLISGDAPSLLFMGFLALVSINLAGLLTGRNLIREFCRIG